MAKFGTVITLTLLVFLHVACLNSPPADVSTASGVNRPSIGGNGAGYNGVISYYWLDKNFTCPGSIDRVAGPRGTIDVTYENKRPVRAISKGNACEPEENEISLKEIDFSKTTGTVLGHKSGIYENTDPWTEYPLTAWCFSSEMDYPRKELSFRMMGVRGFSGRLDSWVTEEAVAARVNFARVFSTIWPPLTWVHYSTDPSMSLSIPLDNLTEETSNIFEGVLNYSGELTNMRCRMYAAMDPN